MTTIKKQKKGTGFSLLELVITLGIAVAVITALLGFAVHILRTVSLSKNQLIAYNLAREGAEITYNLATGWDIPTGSDTGTGNIKGYTGLGDYTVIAFESDQMQQLHSWTQDNEKLYLCPTTGYEHPHSNNYIKDPADPNYCGPTPFRRKITVLKREVLFNLGEWSHLTNFIGVRYIVVSRVSWDSAWGEQKVSIPKELIYFVEKK